MVPDMGRPDDVGGSSGFGVFRQVGVTETSREGSKHGMGFRDRNLDALATGAVSVHCPSGGRSDHSAINALPRVGRLFGQS
jgi:hypothetical protein